MTFIDFCVPIDVIGDDRHRADWPLRQVEVVALNGKLAINAIIFA